MLSEVANFLAVIFWPALVLGLALAVAWRFVSPGRLRTNLQIIASLLVFVPQLLIIFLLYQSITLLLYQEALLSLWMLGVATLIAWQLWKRWSGRTGEPPRLNRLSRWRATEDEVAFQSAMQSAFRERQQKRNPLVLIVIVLLFGGFGIYLGDTFILDAFASRVVVRGTVQSLKYNRGSRAPRLSTVIIDGDAFNATRDMHSQLHSGDQIRAEIGVGSHAILRFSNDARR
jgi:hypothetical protein